MAVRAEFAPVLARRVQKLRVFRRRVSGRPYQSRSGARPRKRQNQKMERARRADPQRRRLTPRRFFRAAREGNALFKKTEKIIEGYKDKKKHWRFWYRRLLTKREKKVRLKIVRVIEKATGDGAATPIPRIFYQAWEVILNKRVTTNKISRMLLSVRVIVITCLSVRLTADAVQKRNGKQEYSRNI